MKPLLCLLFYCCVPPIGCLHAQLPGKADLPDSFPAPHRFGLAAGELGLAGIAPFCFDRYISRQSYAKISFRTVAYNLAPHSWTWDDDGFQTNQIGHPFHGSIFFNAFRSNGYSFWQSVPAAFAGSYLWETFAENQPPAPNDFINTGFGGIVLGEMTHRLAGKLVNNHSRGMKRQFSEVIALLINPAGGFSRIINGKWGRPALYTRGEESTRIAFEWQAGLRKYNVNEVSPFRDGHLGLYGRIKLSYGNPYEDLRQPFSNLHLVTEFGRDDSSKINIVSVYGSLCGWNLTAGKIRQVAVLSANYDYINNEAFFYSGQSIRVNLHSECTLPREVKINTSLALGPVLLAAVPDGYLYHTRNYDYGPGVAFSAAGGITIAGTLFYGINYRGGWMKTVNGNRSGYFLYALTNEAGVNVTRELSLVMEEGYFKLHGNYEHYKTVNKTYPYLRLSARWKMDLP